MRFFLFLCEFVPVCLLPTKVQKISHIPAKRGQKERIAEKRPPLGRAVKYNCGEMKDFLYFSFKNEKYVGNIVYLCTCLQEKLNPEVCL